MRNQRRLKKINCLTKKYQRMSDSELKMQVPFLKEMLRKEVSREEGLLEGFSLIREANARVLGLYPTNEQVLAGLILYDGKVVEMKTGEGKSLVATFPLFVKGLMTGPVFFVTTNDYLVHRDYERIGKVYKWLGLTVSENFNSTDEEFDIELKKQIYSADIVYVSNSVLGFDFLINGLAENQEKQFLPSLKYAILDEVDDILLDSAQTPLVISGAPKVQSNYFKICNRFILTLQQKKDFKLSEDGQSVWLTEIGIEKAKRYFAVPDLLTPSFFSLYQHIILALMAHKIMKKERDYLIEDGKVKLLDKKDGRILEGTNLQSGLHQAIEAKEHVEITPETQVISTITYQNLFQNFKEIAGMSGTVKVVEDEFINTYNLSVKRIKTHKKSIRKDHRAEQFVTIDQKFKAILKKIEFFNNIGRPILVITESVDASELFSLELYKLGISHNLLNAKSYSKEAQIIKMAGEVGSVTVSTAMAGRGTDISLSQDSIDRGGLAVIITERMSNKRIELQAKGRAGRQGEPGDTYIFESLEDEVIQRVIRDRVQKYYDKHKRLSRKISSHKIQRVFRQAQQLIDDNNYLERIRTLQFDETVRIQKKLIDESRRQVLGFSNISEVIDFISPFLDRVIQKKFFNYKEIEAERIQRFILDYIDYNFKSSFLDDSYRPQEIIEYVKAIWELNLNHKRQIINDDLVFLQYLQITILKGIDESWSQQVDLLSQLRFVVNTRTIAQKKDVEEFEKEAQRHYQEFQTKAIEYILKNIGLSLLQICKGELIVTFP